MDMKMNELNRIKKLAGLSGINEVAESDNFREINKGREGKTVLNTGGLEMPNTLYLGDDDYLEKKGNNVTINQFNSRKNQNDKMVMSLAKIKLMGKMK